MRSAIKNGYVRALAFARVDRIMREIQARSGTVLVLKLHRISPVSNPYWAPLTPEAFDALAAFLTSSCQCSTFAGLPPMKAAASRPVVVLSFDDGYRDFIEYAMPILHRYGIRANQNVIGLSVETGRPPWTIMVSDALSAASPERVRQTRIVGFPHRLTGTDDVSKARFGAALSTYLKVMHPLRRRFVWPEIQTLLDETSPDRWTKMMSSTELQEVASTHELGCHSYSHESMEHLDDRQFCVDFDQCRSLFDTIDRRINVYAFPNDSYRRTHIDILRERGVEHVLVGPDPKAHLIGLRQRVPIYGDSEAELRLRAMAAPFPTRTWPHSS